MALDTQVHIYSVDTSAFYNEEESNVSTKIYELQKKVWDLEKKVENSEDEIKKIKTQISDGKTELKKLLKNHHAIRKLKPECLSVRSTISLFESTLTRTLDLSKETVNDELILVRVFYFDVFRDLVTKGFYYNNEKYVFFTASAGQIRTKKNVFIKESTLNKNHNTLFCGLSLETINNLGGVNRNKYIAYLALCNSATDKWTDFDINKSIVVDDVETNVWGEVDYIHSDTWEIERKEMAVPINHTDGCGMVLPRISKHNFMIRLPWVKGLLVSFPFDDWVKEHNGNPVIKDIYGKEYNIYNDDIEIIFTKSQFKMWKYYKDWQEYQTKFLSFGCEAGICNVEKDKVDNACLSYQMLQTLTDLSNEELTKISINTNHSIENISSNRNTMLKAFGVKPSNTTMNYFQKSLKIYPEMISDAYTRNILSEIKNKYVKEGRAGRLRINGKYTFISPDWYAMCERIFLGIANPKGLIKDGEIFCSLYKNKKKLDCLRSPHLFVEHAIRKNICDNECKITKWFCTGAMYTSCHDLISKMLQFDVDGDTSLVVADETIINVAERNIKRMNIVPLYYEMKKAKSSIINNDVLYEGMISAYTGGNIGESSNRISKIWNCKNPDIDLIKCLCRQNNEVIDYAKTLYKTPLTKEIEDKIKNYDRQKLPHFFIYAKNKNTHQVAEINNSSVNQLHKIIKNPKFNFNETELGKFNYRNLMRDQMVEYNKTSPKHINIISLYKSKIAENYNLFNDLNGENGNYSFIYKQIKASMINEFGDIFYITDILISYLFGQVKSRRKSVFWGAFGDIVYNNLKTNIASNTFSCGNCGNRIEKNGGSKRNAQKYCKDCSSDIQYYKPIKTKILKCIDCGENFTVNSMANNRPRCDECAYRKRKQDTLLRVTTYRNKVV